MSENRKSVMERRTSTESRLDMLEFRITQIDSFIKKDTEEREKILEILKSLQIEQAKTHTIMGSAAFLASGAIYAGWFIIQSVFNKFYH